jgi:gluconolactonase
VTSRVVPAWPVCSVAVVAALALGCGSAGAPAGASGGQGGSTGVVNGGAGGSRASGGGSPGGARGQGGADGAAGAGGTDTGELPGIGDGGNRDGDTAGTAPDAAAVSNPLGPAGGDCPMLAGDPDPVPPGASATLVKGGFIFTEGPVWIARAKALLFTEFPEDGTRGRINSYNPADGSFALFYEGIGVNGLAADDRGGLVGASHGLQGITRFDLATRTPVPIPGGEEYQGKKFNSPNDVVVRADGNIYFTDPSYQRPANSGGQGVTAIYHWKNGTVTRHGAGPPPNAIGISVDGKWLYVTSSMVAPVRKFALAEDGTVGDATPFVNMISQGFAIDCAGNVYLTSDKMVRVFSPAGQPRGTIGGFPQELTNLAFGDEDRKTLYITARPGSLYKVRLAVPGYPN